MKSYWYKMMDNRNWKEKFGRIHETTVNGKKFTYWSDTYFKKTFARDEETLEIKSIKGSGYITKDLTVRKAIALAYGLETFRK